MRFSPSRLYLSAGLVALLSAALSGWCSIQWPWAAIPAALLFLSGTAVLVLALQPTIEIHEKHLVVGKRAIPWQDIQRLDRTGWISPLVVHLTLTDGTRRLVVFPGDLDTSHRLLRLLRRYSKSALIDGYPYKQFWGEELPPAERKALPPPRYPLLRPEDEAEVERMYHRLKTVGHLDPTNEK